MTDLPVEPRDLRRLVGWALVAGLSVAALVAIGALTTGSFDDTDWKVVGTSLGFSVFTSTAAAGGAVRLVDAAWARSLGDATIAVSAAAFVLLVAGLWIAGGDDELVWRAFGTAGLLALWTSHASLVLRALALGDSSAVRWLTEISVAALGVDTSIGILAVLGTVDDYDDSLGRVLAVLLVVTLLSTALPPILRRLQRADAHGAPTGPASRPLAADLAAMADRLEAMNLPAEARHEVSRLRELARQAAA